MCVARSPALAVSQGMYHWGVIKCLFEENLLPPVVCGSSIGALFAALLGIHSDSQLSAMFDDREAIDISAFEHLGEEHSWMGLPFCVFNSHTTTANERTNE